MRNIVMLVVALAIGEEQLQVDEYQVPYCNMVPHDPNFEEMKKVVGVDGQRPPIPARWGNCEVSDEDGVLFKASSMSNITVL